ncbi:hypothetical protein ACR3YO_000586 [Escherichia coli]
MTKRRKKYQEKEEIRHPDSPEGLVVAAANNRAFAERLVGVYRLKTHGTGEDGEANTTSAIKARNTEKTFSKSSANLS